VLGCVPKGGPVWPGFARGPCLLHRKPFGVTSQVDVYVVRSYFILSCEPRARGVPIPARRLLPHVPFMDVYLFSLVVAKGGCIVGF
jgi:hypothetical protein